MSATKRKEIVISNENFGDLLLSSTQEALDHARGRVTLKSEALELPNEPPRYSKTKIKKNTRTAPRR